MKFIIDFIPHHSASSTQEYFTTHQCTVEQHLSWLGETYIVDAPYQPPLDPQIVSIVQDRQIEIQPFGTPNILQVIDMNDEDAWWKLATIDIKNYDTDRIVHYRNTLPVNVYVFDSGCDLTHPEFQNTGAELIYSYDGTTGDSKGHGTAVASIIGGVNLSLANVNLRILKIYGDTPTMLSHLVEALNVAIDDHKKLGIPSIANFSWGVAKDAWLDSKIEQLFNNDIKVICAAGSSNTSILELTPQSSMYITVVGGYNQEFTPCDYSSASSLSLEQRNLVNTGVISVWAPGEQIKVATPGNSYAYYSGTSIASAIHASSLAHTVGGYYSTHAEGKYLSAKNFLYSLNSSVSSARTHLIELHDMQDAYFSKTAASTVRSQIRNASDIMLNPTLESAMFHAGVFVVHKFFFTTGVESVHVIEDEMPTGLSFVDGCIVGKTDDIETDKELYVFRVQFKMIGVNVYHQKTLKIKLLRRTDHGVS